MKSGRGRRQFLKDLAAGVTATCLSGDLQGISDGPKELGAAKQIKPTFPLNSEPVRFVEVAGEAGVIAPN
ncbi:MAG: hypothetical protein ACRD2G_17845, partial [Terriglobia bacterium]